MVFLPPKEVFVSIILSFYIVCTTSSPVSQPRNIEPTQKRTSLNVLKTTVTDSHIIDWVERGSQGQIANPPPPRVSREGLRALAELEQPGAELGPPGTVPIPRLNSEYLAKGYSKVLPGAPSSRKRQQAIENAHWHVSSTQVVDNIGGSCVFSRFKAYTQSTADFSLLQTAVIRKNVLVQWGPGPTDYLNQTLEAGWINFVDQVSQPHLFTYYTTNNYFADGDNQGGYNMDYAGWVQVDSTIHPGSVFTPLSVDGGAQQNLKVEYNLHQGNWWLAVEDRWIGYYPATLFSRWSPDPAETTLADHSDEIRFYGEVYNSETTLSTTDMGSGEYAATGYGKAGYIFNMTYTNLKNVSTPYNGVFSEPDAGYTYEAHMLSGTDRGSYAFIGGPGAGGVVGG